MMPVVKDPLMSGQGKTENVVRQVVVVPFSSDRPGDAAARATASSAAAPAAQTPEMQEEMRKLIDAARSAVADLQAAAPAAPVEAPYVPRPAPAAVAPVIYPAAQAPTTAPEGVGAPPQVYPQQAYPPQLYGPPPGYGLPSDLHAGQALEAATAMARASTSFGRKE